MVTTMGQPISGAASHAVPAVGNDEDEWEYEYDPNDTEDLYFTLDLTTHAPDALVQKPAPTNGNRVNEPRQRSPSPDENDDEEDEGPLNEDVIPLNPVGKLQIIDLHTTNPLVKFDDQVFSCYWSTDIGTQVHIAQAGVTSNPRRAGTVLDIVGTSQTRLIGKPATLKSRTDVDDVEPQRQNGLPSNFIEIRDGSESEQQNDGTSQYSTPAPDVQQPGQPLQVPRENLTSRAARAQASFMERLSAIKLRKGEKDTIPIHGARIYNLPDNIDEIRQRDMDAEAERTKKARDDALAAMGHRPRKRRRKLTLAEKGIVPPGGMVTRDTMTPSLGLQSNPPSDQANRGAADNGDAKNEDVENGDAENGDAENGDAENGEESDAPGSPVDDDEDALEDNDNG